MSSNKTHIDQKIFRWSFEAVVSDNERETKTFAVPGITLGSRKDGRAAADHIEAGFHKEMGDEGTITVRVRPVMHERISHELVVEMHRLSTKAQVYQQVSERFAQRLKATSPDYLFRASEDILNDEIKSVMIAHKKPELVAELVPTYKEEPPEDDQPRMRLGIQAVNDILAAPVDYVSGGPVEAAGE